MCYSHRSCERPDCSAGRRGSLASVPASRLGTLWLLAVCLATIAGRSSWADDSGGHSPASRSILRIARQAAPRPEAEPGDVPPQLLPPPKAPAKEAVETLPPARTESPAAPPRGTPADRPEEQENLDPGIRPVGSLTVNIAPPETRDDQGQPLAPPPDVGRDYFARQVPTAPSRVPYSPWMLDTSYGPSLNFCYRPLFFEDGNLERYGHSWGLLQPAVSAAKFYGNVALVPYRVVAQHPCECTYHDHLFRPGARAPREIPVPQRPLSHLID